jgi:hypothetical protein
MGIVVGRDGDGDKRTVRAMMTVRTRMVLTMRMMTGSAGIDGLTVGGLYPHPFKLLTPLLDLKAPALSRQTAPARTKSAAGS